MAGVPTVMGLRLTRFLNPGIRAAIWDRIDVMVYPLMSIFRPFGNAYSECPTTRLDAIWSQLIRLFSHIAKGCAILMSGYDLRCSVVQSELSAASGSVPIVPVLPVTPFQYP